MCNRLPPELVRQIIESAIPSTYHALTYYERQATLQSFCLVCTLFQDIAQPLLVEFVRTDEQWKSDALLTLVERKRWNSAVRKVIVRGRYGIKVVDLTKLIQSCHGLRSLNIDWDSDEPLDLSALQDLPHLADLCLCGWRYQFAPGFALLALTSLSIDHTAIQGALTLLNPAVLPSLQSLAMFEVCRVHHIASLDRSRLANLVPQLATLHLDSRIVEKGLDYLVPAFSRTLFDYGPPSPGDQIDLLQVAQHLRIPKYLDYEEDLPELLRFIENTDRQISLRTLYLDISLKDLPSPSADVMETVRNLAQVCRRKAIEVVYERQEGIYGYSLTASAEFARRQRKVRKSETVDR